MVFFAKADETQFVPHDSSFIHLNEVEISTIKSTATSNTQTIAFTLIKSDDVKKLKISSMKDVGLLAPNFYIPNYGSRMTSTIYVRGLGARIDQPAMGLNVDNVPILNKDNYDFDLVDIDHIEVLRGPQSTLYGRNTMGGLVNIYTTSPLRYQGLRALAEYGKANSYKASISYYDMLSDVLGMGASAYFTSTDGFFTNLYNGKKVDKEKQGSFRWKTAWRPGAQWSVDNTASISITRQGGYPYESLASGLISHNDTCFYRRTGITDGLTAKWSYRNISISSISSFQYIADNMTLDQDFLPDDYFTLTQRRHEWAITEDVIARGHVKQYNWLAGVFGFHRTTDMWAPVIFHEDGINRLITYNRNTINPTYPIYWDEDRFALNSDFNMITNGVALYHQSNYATGNWDFTLGLRLDYEKSSLKYHSYCSSSYSTFHKEDDGTLNYFSTSAVEVNDNDKISKDFMELLPKFTINYHLPLNNSSVHGTISKGYKSGGFNTQMFSDVLQQRIMELMGLSMNYKVDEIIGYKPEVSWNYELGTHLESNDSRFSIDIDVFYIACRDQQLTMFPTGVTTGRIMTNAGKTNSYGVEVSASYRPTDAWTFNASYGYTHATFKEFNNGINDYAGKRLPYAPAQTLAAAANYSLNIGTKSSLDFNVNMRGIGDIYWNEANTVKQPFYALLNASITYQRPNYSVSIWSDNITSTKYATFYFVSIGNSFVQRGNPFRAGVTLRLNLPKQ
jgi:outer membrane receptor protein involved in Fe transport